MDKRTALSVIQKLTPHFKSIGLQQATAVPLDFFSNEFFLELQTLDDTLISAFRTETNVSVPIHESLYVKSRALNLVLSHLVGQNDLTVIPEEQELAIMILPVTQKMSA